MAAVLVWGKGFRVTDEPLPSGEPFQSVTGIAGGVESISWSSLEEIMRLTEKHGVSRSVWPVYPDCDIESKVPREDAQRRSAELRLALERLDSNIIESNDWLSFLYKILQEGNCFFAMA